MGYHTAYELVAHNATSAQADAVEKELSDRGVIGYALESRHSKNIVYTGEGVFWGCHELVWWRNDEEDMRAISAQFPEVLFELYGDGDASDDDWVQYFLGGKAQFCRILNGAVPPFDPMKLT